MEWTLLNIFFVTATICTGSILQASTGLGSGLIIVPLLALISYSLIPGPMIFASLSLTVAMTLYGWRDIDRDHMGKLLLGLLLGIIFAASIVSYLPLSELGLVFGLLILVAVMVSVWARNANVAARWYPLIGALSGFMGTTAAVGAPVLALLYQNRRGPTIRATLACLYVISSVVILLSLHFAGRFGYQDVLSGIYLIPGFVVGYFIAPLFTRWIDQGYARPAVLFVSGTSALLLIIKSIVN